MGTDVAAAQLQVLNLSKHYHGVAVVDNVSLTVAPGEFVALLGPSGAGKTTLFRCVAALTPLDGGTVVVNRRELHTLRGAQLCAARRDIGVIFQQFNLVRRLTALHNVLAGRLGYVPTWRVLLRRFPAADRQLALACLDWVGLLGHAYQRADRLSGGQQQRVAIARVLAQQSRFILADEPVASLDPETAESVLDTLRSIARERGIAVLCSLHQVDLATRFADRILGMRQGRLLLDLPTAQLSAVHRNLLYAAAAPEAQSMQQRSTPMPFGVL
ncbi:MAG: phosphonate ABC transporter ATP-binding protein [Candidatus Tectomicrobia bacterium]|uniref:Phosphonate ABC transporter ATP-binding protein n=1 Tax=Tectimicrobiota bacterium TaxID=2528274 RepID=A0A937W1K5_UNCTE|nr:phosphonate ABC transporter ATP-binding protein [Candidatus Tectomicrobia bacterium]